MQLEFIFKIVLEYFLTEPEEHYSCSPVFDEKNIILSYIHAKNEAKWHLYLVTVDKWKFYSFYRNS